MTTPRRHQRLRRNRRRRLRRWAKRSGIVAAATLAFGTLTLLILHACFPFPLETIRAKANSISVTTRDGAVLLKTTARDGQWRTPIDLNHVSPWLVQATIAAEDKRFWSHPGVDLVAVVRAALQNTTNLRIVSGASTLTMQTCRMSDPAPRTFWNKARESFRALQLERILSKSEILAVYLNDAPFGGNIRGAEAAAMRYWGKHATDLSLDEAALLAGLPQLPERYRPDRHPAAAERRRSWVLVRMVELGQITEEQAAVADKTPITLRTPPPQTRIRGAAWAALARRPEGGQITLDGALQSDIERIVRQHVHQLPRHTQVAVVAIDIDSAEIRAWVASADPTDPISGQVDGVQALRSPGSALKPFIYAAAFETKRLSPESELLDVPIERDGWNPHNFDPEYHGRVRADDALRRSLNVPAILLSEQIGLSRCAGVLRSCGVPVPVESAQRAGLALAVGATEVTLLDLTNAYATLGRQGIRRSPKLFADEPSPGSPAMSASACAAIDDILSSTHRAPSGADPASPAWFMWKTGTSSGRRDAWAVGHNTRFAIGVWVGRFSGTGNAEYVGKAAAEPILTAIFQLRPIRRNAPPPPAESWTVEHPLPQPAELDPRLRILSPHAGARFIAVAPAAVIHAKANREAPVFWFLNGELVGREPEIRLTANPGHYELSCCDDADQFDRVEFQITR